MRNRVLFRKQLTNGLYCTNLFLRKLMLIWPIIAFSKFFNPKFLNTLFSMFAPLDSCVYRTLLVEIDPESFALDILKYVGSVFLCVRVSQKLW